MRFSVERAVRGLFWILSTGLLAGILSGQAVPFSVGGMQTIRPSTRGSAAVVFEPNLNALRAGAAEFQISLPEGPTVIVQRTGGEDRGEGSILWYGTILFSANSNVMFTLHKGVLAGTIRSGADVYVVRGTPDRQVIEKLAPTNNVRDDGTTARFGVSFKGADSAQRNAQPDTTVSGPQRKLQIDVMGLYTPMLMNSVGGQAAAEALIQMNVDAANLAFENSRLRMHYRLVRTELASGPFAQDPVAPDIVALRQNSYLTNLRRRYGADLVAVFVASLSPSSLCGVADAGRVYDPRDPAFLQFTAPNCLDELTYAHENGHLLGMDHNPEDALPSSFAAFYPFARGHYLDGVFGTVMSYRGPTVPYFSNPSVRVLGNFSGIRNERDNAQVAELNAPGVAALLAPPPPPVVPAIPTNLAATLTLFNGMQVDLTWNHVSTDQDAEDRFEVFRSTDGTNFSLLAQVPATEFTSAGYSDTNLSAALTYSYRVRAVNSAGASGFSNTASVDTPSVPVAPSGLTANPLSTTSVRLQWTDNSSDELGFVVASYDVLTDQFIAYVGSVAPDETTLDLTGLTPSTAYRFRVFAYNDAGVSALSNVATVTTP